MLTDEVVLRPPHGRSRSMIAGRPADSPERVGPQRLPDLKMVRILAVDDDPQAKSPDRNGAGRCTVRVQPRGCSQRCFGHSTDLRSRTRRLPDRPAVAGRQRGRPDPSREGRRHFATVHPDDRPWQWRARRSGVAGRARPTMSKSTWSVRISNDRSVMRSATGRRRGRCSIAKSSCGRRRRWKRSGGSPAASRTTSTTC